MSWHNSKTRDRNYFVIVRLKHANSFGKDSPIQNWSDLIRQDASKMIVESIIHERIWSFDHDMERHINFCLNSKDLNELHRPFLKNKSRDKSSSRLWQNSMFITLSLLFFSSWYRVLRPTASRTKLVVFILYRSLLLLLSH